MDLCPHFLPLTSCGTCLMDLDPADLPARQTPEPRPATATIPARPTGSCPRDPAPLLHIATIRATEQLGYPAPGWAIAELLDVSSRTIVRWRHGRRIPLDDADRYAVRLDLHIDQIWPGHEDPFDEERDRYNHERRRARQEVA